MKYHFSLKSLLLFCLVIPLLMSCQNEMEADSRYHIGVSQCSDDSWRTKLNEEMQRELLFHPEIALEVRSADDDNDKQVADIDYFIKKKVDLLIVSPNEAAELTPAVSKAFDEGIPVIVADRKVIGEKYTAFIGGDNLAVGRLMAQSLMMMLPEGGEVIEILGLPGSTPAELRHDGFIKGLNDKAGRYTVFQGVGKWFKEQGEHVTDSLLRLHPDVKIILAQNDQMAIGAHEAIAHFCPDKDIQIIGVDGLTGPGNGVEAIMEDNKNNCESIFAVQHSNYEEDNTKFGRSNWSNLLNGCHGMWSKGWDFHKPSQNLVNAFKVDENGLPMFNDYEKVHNIYPINGVEQDQKWDPRLFHTVGLPTFPYKYESAYTMEKDRNARCPSSYGYYTSLKEVPQRSKGESYTEGTWQGFAMNDYVVRYTEMMLWRAEALIELDQVADGIEIINDIRARANNSVAKYISYASNQIRTLGMYSTTVSKDDARMYLRWEKRLEMAMEAERFFDLRRWGIASKTMNEYWPIPYQQLFYVPGLYTQNAGY